MAYFTSNFSGATFYAGHDLFAQVWDEVLDDYSESSDHGVQRVTRGFMIPWNLKEWFAEKALGGVYHQRRVVGFKLPLTAGSTLNRDIPWQVPTWPWLYAAKVEQIGSVGSANVTTDLDSYGIVEAVDRQGVPNAIGTPGRAHLVVTFESVPYNVISDHDMGQLGYTEIERWVTREDDYAVESLELKGIFKFVPAGAADNIPADAKPIKIMGYRKYRYTWHQVPVSGFPLSAISNCVGKINSAIFDPNHLNAAVGTLLCVAPTSHPPTRNVAGARIRDITYNFIYRRDGWNNILRPSTGAFTEVVACDANGNSLGTPIYPSADFGTLFQVA